mgnify:CR=1 FL=1
MRQAVVGLMLVCLHFIAVAQCNLGDIEEVTVPCLTGWMTSPPRTVQCALPPRLGWVLRSATIGEQPLPGVGGVMSVSPTEPISQERRIGMGRFILNELQSSNSAQNNTRTIQLASLLRSLADGSLPLHQSEGVHVNITLRPGPGPAFLCPPGATTNYCPHAMVQPVRVHVICLPSAE